MYHQNQQFTSNQSSLKRDHEDDDETDFSKQTKKRCKYFYPIARDVWDSTSDKHEKWVKHYEKDDPTCDAQEVAFDVMDDKHKRYFFRVYTDFLVKALYARKSRLHQKVLEYATRLHKNGVPAEYAVKLAIRENRDEFDTSEFVKHAAIEGDSEDEEVEDDESSDDDSSDEQEENSGDESDKDEVAEDTQSSNSGASSGTDA